MSQPCEITGLSEENVAKLSYLHKYITTDIEIPTPDEKSLNGFIKPLENIVASNKIHSSEKKRKESLLKHLEKSIASKFEGSKLSPFGSAESGLSLKGGDFDLCLQISNADEKKTIKRIRCVVRSFTVFNSLQRINSSGLSGACYNRWFIIGPAIGGTKSNRYIQ